MRYKVLVSMFTVSQNVKPVEDCVGPEGNPSALVFVIVRTDPKNIHK